MGVVYVLGAVQEKLEPMISQFKFGFEDDREFIEYTENGSKNLSGSYKDKSGNKTVKNFADSYQNASYSHRVQYIRFPPMGVIGTWPELPERALNFICIS